MTTKNIVKKLKIYQSSSAGSKKRRNYIRGFELKMIYRTTKTENPQTTMKMVEAVLGKMR